jgi:hypothetical protein
MHCGVLGWGTSESQCENMLDCSALLAVVLVEFQSMILCKIDSFEHG